MTILNENKCGYQSEAGDGESLAREIQYLSLHQAEATDMGARAKLAYQSKYSSEQSCKAWRNVLYTIVQSK